MIASLWAANLIGSLVFEVTAGDACTLLSAGVGACAAALLAGALLPAHAARTNPVERLGPEQGLRSGRSEGLLFPFMTQPLTGPSASDANRAVADAIQALMAARLGLGFLPLGILFALGAFGAIRGAPMGMPLALGTIATSAAMLAYGLRVVQRAIGRPDRIWMSLATAGSVVPPLFSLYVVGWLGLKQLSDFGSAIGWGLAIVHVGVGLWVLRCWMRVVEIERLAQVMTFNLDGEGGPV